ncbi:pentatricopeptide repeat-containing protein At4g13650-like [Magnolia sinica]|uniref:pentatricopeptide repeat-containing protein At4g13650-like n=1 Tax=Magnolia sinica TaxID=86752 RepID=UPI002658613D|nr:pentatricopeptide repeat-containing protein At4g13650-like [Magnolia sinica]
MKRIKLSLNYKSFKFKFFIPFNSSHQLHTSKPSSLSADISKGNDQTALSSLLILSSKTKSLLLGNQIHAQIIKSGLSKHTYSQNNLISMYSKCGVLGHALRAFDEMPERNLVSWTSIMSGAVQSGELEIGLELFLEMMEDGFRPNEFGFSSVLRACANAEAIEFGSCVHCLALKMGIEMNLFVGSLLLHMYAKCGDVEAAKCVFGCMSDRDVACWNAMVGGYAINGYSFEVMELVSFMHRNGLVMDEFTFINALKGCSISGDLSFGLQIHGLIIHNEVEFSSSVMNSLINLYFKAGRKDWALMLFNSMQQRDVVSWNTVIAGFAQDENVREVVCFFSKMVSTGLKPNQITLSILFRFCGAVGDLFLGFQFYCLAYRLGFLNDALVGNSLIDMFSRCGDIENASFIFESLPTRNVITWNEMIVGCNLNGCSIEALQLFRNLRGLGIEVDEITCSSILGACSRHEHQEIGRQIHAGIIKSGFDSHCFVCCSLINAYARIGWVDDSFKIFCSIDVLDLASWGAMISAFSQEGCSYEALVLLNRLRETGEKPDEFILGSTLNACANIAAFNQSKCIHLYVVKTGFEKHLCIASAIIDAYAKCGDIDSSRKAFVQLSRDNDAILFNTMITAYAQHGLITEAIGLFEKMKRVNLRPNHATFVSVISACSHLGLVDQGRKFFDSISSDYGMHPSAENFACLVDLLARSGFVEEAKEVIEDMPFEPWAAVWRSLLSGCRINGNRELGELAAEQLLHLMPDNDATYVLLSKVYAEEGCWEDVAKVRRTMKERGVMKEPGYSWIEI